MRLPVALEQGEIVETARKLADQMALRDRLESDLGSVKRQIGADIEKCDAEIAKYREIVASGKEYRDVECSVLRDWSRGIKRTVRVDTGELVSEVLIPDDERQVRAEFDEAGPK